MTPRDKRESPITLRVPTTLKLALREVARREDRSVSTWLLRLAEREPSVQIALQQIGGRIGNQ